MGNVLSCCCRKSPCERQDEGQRLLHESIPSPQTSTKTVEACPVNADCTTPESSETSSPADEKVTDQLKAGLTPDASQPELIPSQVAVQEETDVLATEVKLDAPAVANNVHLNAVPAVDNTSILAEQQEVAAGVVLQVLADATKIVNGTSLASQTPDVSSGGVEPRHALHEKVERQAASMEKLEAPSITTNSHIAVAEAEVESQSALTLIRSETVSTDKVERLDTASDSQAEGESGCTLIESNRSQAVSAEELEGQDTATVIENHTAASVSESQAAIESLESHISATVIDSQATSSITDNQAVSAKIVPVIPACSVNTEAQDNFAKITETTPPRTPEKKDVFAELQQVPIVHLNGSLGDGVSVRENAEVVILPQEQLGTIDPPVTEVKLLVQNFLAEEGLNETPKELLPSPEVHAQFGLPPEQDDPSTARDGEPDRPLHSNEDEQLAPSAVPEVEAKYTESLPQHSGDVGHVISMEGFSPVSGLEPCSTLTDPSASMQNSMDKTRTDEHLNLTEEACKEEDASVTSENEVHTGIRDSAADSGTQDVVGLTSVSSLEDLLEEEQVAKQDVQDVEIKSVATGYLMDGGLAMSPQDERRGSFDRLSLTESDGNDSCEEDLYRGEEEIEEELEKRKLSEITVPGLEDRCSLEPPIAILTYSEREWKGQTAKSAVIKQGYAELSQTFGCLRRVRGDNYCALRATLFQALMNTTQLPEWLQQDSFLLIPEELEARYGLIKGWRFPEICCQINGTENAVDMLKHYLALLQKWWYEAATSSGPEGHMRVCDKLFQGGVDEFGLMEALKVLMLARAVELHTAMQSGDDVPIFCWLLFARDTSSCPRTLVSNHLSQVGFSGGLEQVEMFLLGYALRHTIKAYRLYMAGTEEFVTHYPDDHIRDWPCLCLVTEDDRHYNVAIGDTAHPKEDQPAGLCCSLDC